VRLRVVVLYTVEGREADPSPVGKFLLGKQRPLPHPLHLSTNLHHLRLSGMCSHFTTNGKKTVYKRKTYGIMKASEKGMAPRVLATPRSPAHRED
jgi:hypothetical protein